jgi:uncharacterized protein YjbI with pentapeptide repeats
MLASILNLTPEQKRNVAKEIGPLHSVTEFCSNLLEATKEVPLKDKFAKLLPWAAKGGKIISEVTPLAKVLLKLVDEVVKEKDPDTLGLLACSLAYQRSAALALAQQGEPRDRIPFERSLESVRKDLKTVKSSSSLAGFSLAAPLAHPFVWQADDSLFLVVRSHNYSDSEWRQIQLHVHEQFRTDLVEVLSHGETAAKFEPFTRKLSLGDSSAAYAALNAHIERQRWLFEDKAVLNIEPFTLSEVYVDTDCGRLRWKDFPSASDSTASASGDTFDPFSEKCGGRYPLLETVLDYFRNPKFNDAVVIQGAPGCGKSSFTLRLANALRREGLRPLRIRLKFLNLKRNLSEALAQVVLQPEEDEDPALTGLSQCSDPFLNDSILHEKTKFGDADMCPYILILDGWDEISVAVNEGFETEVHRMLEGVRREFLDRRALKVRVLLTGRPSHAVERSLFLREDTPVLTIREYTADQLESYAAKVKTALQRAITPAVKSWPAVNWQNLGKVFATYRKNKSSLDILGLPLLAHLSLRLLAEWQGETDQLLSNRTALYRHLLDVTCAKAGKAASDPDDLYRQSRISGSHLRKMLQQTAIAITTYGNESIPFRELQLRLKKNRRETMEAADSAGRDHPLTSLMISFYFKGGREHLGCEFLHKSFREYLYAEAVTEMLKMYGQKLPVPLTRREPYWKDFQETDPRRQFSRELSQVLCPRPLTQEIRAHIKSLLEWEIRRSYGQRGPGKFAHEADVISFDQWELVRDNLTDLWDWWGEAVHLRPQPYRDDSDNLRYHPALVNELLDYSLPRDRSPDALEWWPGRLVNADANIGDALCQLNVWIHSVFLQLSRLQGVHEVHETGESSFGSVRYPYQSRYRHPNGVAVLFRPSGLGLNFFRNYCTRINASGNRQFPAHLDLDRVDLSNVNLSRIMFFQTNLSKARLKGTNFNLAILTFADISEADLEEASLFSAEVYQAHFAGANLKGAELKEAKLVHSLFDGANLSKANLMYTDLKGASCRNVNLRDANLIGVGLQRADLRGADLSGADLRRADLQRADLRGANFEGADLMQVDLREADIEGTNGLSEEHLANSAIKAAPEIEDVV